jgi:hypothetical protein
VLINLIEEKSLQRESNPQPPVYKTDALTVIAMQALSKMRWNNLYLKLIVLNYSIIIMYL